MYGFFADLIVGVHVAYVGFVLVGLLLIVLGWILGCKWVRNFWFRITHLMMMLAVVYEEIMEIRCPLSVLEEKLRALKTPRWDVSWSSLEGSRWR